MRYWHLSKIGLIKEVGHCDLILLRIFFHFDNSEIKVQLILYTKFQPNILSGSGGNFDFSGLAIFSNSGHIDFRPA